MNLVLEERDSMKKVKRNKDTGNFLVKYIKSLIVIFF